MPEPLLSLSGVNTHIGQYHILQGVDFAVERNSLTMLLGRNGAGKTVPAQKLQPGMHVRLFEYGNDLADLCHFLKDFKGP